MVAEMIRENDKIKEINLEGNDIAEAVNDIFEAVKELNLNGRVCVLD